MIPSPSGLPRIVPVLKRKILHLKNPSGKLGELVPLKNELAWVRHTGTKADLGTRVHPSLKLKWLRDRHKDRMLVTGLAWRKTKEAEVAVHSPSSY